MMRHLVESLKVEVDGRWLIALVVLMLANCILLFSLFVLLWFILIVIVVDNSSNSYIYDLLDIIILLL